MISLWTFIHGKYGNIGKKNSYNKEASDNSHTYFSHIQREMAPDRTAKPLGGEGFSFIYSTESHFIIIENLEIFLYKIY
jgi:hypothetical protein